MSLHKGAYPARYGGRLGSVLDVHNRDGNRKGFSGYGWGEPDFSAADAGGAGSEGVLDGVGPPDLYGADSVIDSE